MMRRTHIEAIYWMNALAVTLLVGLCAIPARAAEGTQKEKAAKEDKMPDVDFVLKNNIDDKGKGPQPEFRESKGWKVTDFSNTGAVRTEKDTVFLDMGNDMTGITWRGPITKMNYEISLEAKRVDGHDFFCGLTFPYGEDPCSFIVGGWGGTCVGLSSIDYYDAYNNETAKFRDFETDRWYKIRVRVTPSKIEAWIDDEKLVDLETTGRKIGIRWEVEPSRPLGIATWRTSAAVRNVTLMALKSTEPAAKP